MTEKGPASDKYWSDALDRLPDRTKTKLRKILDLQKQDGTQSPPSSEPVFWPDRLRRSCEACRDEYKTQEWTFTITIKKKQCSMLNLWDKTIESLNKLKGIGTIVTSPNPMASLGWGIAQSFIQIPIKKKDVALSVADGLSKVLIVMGRGLVYERQFQNTWETMDQSNIDCLEDILVSLYEQTLIFLVAVSDHYVKGSIRRTWDAVWDSDVINDFDKNTTQLQSELQGEAGTRFMVGVQGDLQTLLESERSLKTRLDDLQKGIMDDLSKLLLVEHYRQEDEKKKKHVEALLWLSRFPYLDHHKFAKRERTPNTGSWIFERNEYKSWSESTDGEILWIHGILGSGKTKLISRVIDRFDNRVSKKDDEEDDEEEEEEKEKKREKDEDEDEDEDESEDEDRDGNESGEDSSADQVNRSKDDDGDGDEDNLRVAFFYCRRDDDARRSSVDILRSLIKQLAEPCDELPPKILKTYQRKGAEDSPSQELTVKDCKSMLADAISHHKNVMLVVDALDECHEDSIKDLLSVFGKITHLSGLNMRVKVVISSRETPEIEKSLIQEHHVGVSAEDIRYDITQFVKYRLEKEESFIKIPAELRDRIIATLSDKTQGMFQWAAMHLENILRSPNTDDIKDALDTPPASLMEIYRVTFENIESDPRWGPYAMRAFAWLQARGGSSTIRYLVVAASQKVERTNSVETGLVNGDELLKACQFLLVKEGELVRFSHLSIQEYYEEHEDKGGESRHLAAMVLMKTLLYYDPETKDPSLGEFYADAVEHWWEKVHWFEGWTDANLLLKRLLYSDPLMPGCRSWLLHLRKSTVKSDLQGYRPFEIAIRFSHAASCVLSPGKWSRSDEPIQRHYFGYVHGLDYINLDKMSLLLLEAFVAGCLLRAKSGLNSECWEIPKTPRRHQATEEATEEKFRLFSLPWRFISLVLQVIVWALLNPPDADVGTARNADVGSDTNSDTDDEEKAIFKRLNGVERTLVELVRALGPSVESSSPSNEFLSGKMVDFFLSSKTAPPKCMKELAVLSLILLCQQHSWSTRQAALVDILFSKYNVNRPVAYEYLDISVSKLDLNMLLVSPQKEKRDADRTLCMIPHELYQLRIIEFLVSNGAEVNFQVVDESKKPEDPGTPLIAAVMGYDTGGAEIMDFLLTRRANINQEAKLGHYRTALIAACALGQTDALHHILDIEGLDVNMTVSGGLYRTALIAACASNRIGIVKRLLRKGAKRTVLAETVFSSALAAGNPVTVALLLDIDIDDDTSVSMPSTQDEATQRWGFFSYEVYTPMLNSHDDDDREWTAQCALAAKQLGVALIYSQLGEPIDWATRHIELAVDCLTIFSSFGEDDHRAARIVVECFGFADQSGPELEALRAVLRGGKKKMKCEGWGALASDLVAHITALNNGGLLRAPVRRASTWVFGSSETYDFDDEDDEDDEDD